jgi:hypothetical protein
VNPVLFCVLLALPSADVRDFETEALDKVNTYRKLAGLPAVKLDADLSRACTSHAQYLLRNLDVAEQGKINVHDEDPKLPGFSEAGRKAARQSVIAQGEGGMPLEGIDLWAASYYHRVSLLDPSLTRIGVGLAERGRSWAFVLDTKGGRDSSKADSTPVCYPGDKQTDVSLLFSRGWPEHPNPIPDHGDPRKVGQPITVSFFNTKAPTIKSVTATLKDGDGNAVEHWLFWSEKPAVKGYGGNTIGLIPKAPLKANTTYTVQVKGQINGADWSKTWSLRTGTTE